MRFLSAASAAFSLLVLCACDNQPAALHTNDIAAARAVWNSHHLTRYVYVYEVTGFLISYVGRPIRLVVLNGSVSTAQDVATDSILPDPGRFPTLDALFDQAQAALAGGSLLTITFDSTFGFPSRMDLAGPPDASGSVLASSLQVLP